MSVTTLTTRKHAMSPTKRYEGKLTEEDRAQLNRLLHSLEAVMGDTQARHMPVGMLAAYLRVAVREGRSVQDLTNEAGVSQSVMSRHLLDLGPWNRDKQPGHGLIEHKLSPMHMRIHEIWLTAKGAALASRVARLLRGDR